MAKTTTLAAVFLCLFAVALARTEPITDDTTSTAVSLPISELKPTSTEIVNGETRSNSEITRTVIPVINYHFNQIKRRFRVRSKYPCHHHHHNERREISYGNDMLVSNPGENSDFPNPESIRAQRKQWIKLHHQRHEEESDSDDEGEDKKVFKRLRFHNHDWTEQVVSDGNRGIKEVFPYHHHHRYHHHHHHDHQREEKKGGLMKLMGDFMNNLF